MQIGDTFEAVAEKPVHGGAMLATAPDERRVFLRGALPGEEVLARVTSVHKKYLWADTVKVFHPSVHRVEGIWPDGLKSGVGGIELAHASTDYQRLWKHLVLAEQISRIGGPELETQVRGFAPDWVVVQPTPTDANAEANGQLVGTRTRIQLVGTKDGRLGMRKFRSHDLVPVDNVPIAVDPINNVSKMFSPENAKAWKGKWKAGEKVSIEAPTDSEPVVVTRRGTFRFRDGKPIGGDSTWSVTAAGRTHKYQVPAGSFWQAHVDAPAVLVEAVLEAAKVQPGQTVLEFYSGAGLFTRFLADEVKPGGQILCLEGDGNAVASAHNNLGEDAESDVVSLYTGAVDEESVMELAAAAGHMVDTIVLDPPRKGAPRDVVHAISLTSATRVVLVSCDPAAAARDLRRFVASGFRLVNMTAWDIFPHSHHFETVAELIR